MNDLLSESFENPRGQGYGGGDLEMGTQREANSGELGLDDFFKKVQAIEKQYEKLNKLLKKLQDAHEESKAVTKAAAMKAIKQRMEKDVDEVGKIARFIKSKIEELDKENLANRQKPGCGKGTGVDRSRTATTLSLKKKFKDKMSEFQALRESIHQEHREVVERRVYTVTGARADEETIDKLIETGDSEQIFQKAIREQGRGQVLDTLAEIQERHDAVREVERKLLELQQEQECLELRKDREKKEKHYKSGFPVKGSKEAGALPTKKPNVKSEDRNEDNSAIRLRAKGKAVGVQTDEHALSNDDHAISTDDHAMLIDATIQKNLPVSRKLAGIWEPQSYQQPKSNLVSKLLVACEADLHFLFGCLGLNVSSKETTTKMDMAPKHGIRAVEAAKVSHFYLTLTKISYDIRGLGDFLEALVDLCCLQSTTVAHRSLCVLHVVLKHILSMENRLRSRDNVIINDPSNANRSSEKHTETGHLLCEITKETTNPHSALTKLIGATKIWKEDTLRDESLPLISRSKWFSFFQMMNQVATQHREEIIRVEAVSIMNILLLRTDAYAERKMYGEVAVFQSISQLLRKEAGLGVQKQTVYLLYLLLNCPSLMSMFCSSCKEEGTSAEVPTTSAETPLASQCSGAILDGLADCLACLENGALTTLVLKLQRKAIILLALLASSGRHGFEVLLGSNLPKRTNFLHLILQILASEIDVEASESIQSSDDFKERTLLIREALILLNRLASHPQYSTPVLRVLTNPSGMACLAVDIAHRVSRKDKWLLQSDTMTRQTRESEVVDLARRFKKTLFAFLEDTTSQK